MELFYGTFTGLYTLHLPIISSVWCTNISLQKTGKTKAGKISTTLGGMWRSVFFFTNFSGKVILYYIPISTIWRPHTVFHVLLYTSFTRILPLQSCLTFFPLKYRSIKSCFLFLLLNVLPVMLVRRERTSVTVIFLSCARVRILLLVGCFILFIHSWNAGNFLGSFLLASLYPKWCLPLYVFPLLPLVLSQGFLALLY